MFPVQLPAILLLGCWFVWLPVCPPVITDWLLEAGAGRRRQCRWEPSRPCSLGTSLPHPISSSQEWRAFEGLSTHLILSCGVIDNTSRSKLLGKHTEGQLLRFGEWGTRSQLSLGPFLWWIPSQELGIPVPKYPWLKRYKRGHCTGYVWRE